MIFGRGYQPANVSQRRIDNAAEEAAREPQKTKQIKGKEKIILVKPGIYG